MQAAFDGTWSLGFETAQRLADLPLLLPLSLASGQSWENGRMLKQKASADRDQPPSHGLAFQDQDSIQQRRWGIRLPK